MRNEIIKVLLVEDNPVHARLIKELLSDAGRRTFEIEVAERLSSALKILARKRFDVVLLDLSLPDSSGLETLIKTYGEASRVAIIVLTGLDDEMIAVEAVKNGAQDYLVKGQINAELLSRAIRYAIERKQVEEALRESEERFRDTATMLPSIIIEYGLDGMLTYVNPHGYRVTGYKPADFEKGFHVLRVVAPAEHEKHHERIQRMMQGEKIPLTEYRLLRKDGSIFWGLVTSSLIRKDGEVVGVRTYTIDISERKLAEDELKKSEKRFRDLVENVLVGICIVKDDQVVYINPEQKKILGKLSGSLRLRDLNIHPEDSEKFIKCYNSMLKSDASDAELEIRLFPFGMHPVGKNRKWVHCNMNWIEYQDGKAVLISMVDITRARELEKLVRIREKMASLGHVAAGIAHEIRNPLSGINVLLSGIDENFEDPESAEDIKELLREAQKASDKIAAVVKRVLDFSRTNKLCLVLTNINNPIMEALRLSKTTLRRAGITLETELGDTLPSLYADSQLMEQVMLNLVNNAAEAMKHMREEKRVKISTRSENGVIIISVSDAGPGIPEEIREKIFDPFYTTKSDGSGIGLSMCQRIIADHGGTIDVLTSEWDGAEFRINMPINKRKNPR